MFRYFSAAICIFISMLLGCTPPKLPDPGGDKNPAVQVSTVVQREITENVRFTGRFNAINYVEIRARSTGYVVSTPFKEGSYVQKGDLLFAIDPRPYQAKLDDANGEVKLSEAKLKLAKADNLRAKDVAKTPGAISKQDLDKYDAAEEEAVARVEALKATMEVQNLNLEFCSVISPISGRVSKYFVTLGNLVTQDSTQLTTVVSEDPVYCYFDADERTLLKVIRMVQSKNDLTLSTADSINRPVFIGLADEKGFPHQGTLNFSSNLVDSQTGTITLRAIIKNIFKNDKTPLFLHGMFCRVLLPISDPKNTILVADRAIGTDQGLKFVYVMDKDNKLEYRRVSVGELQPDNLRAIESGLNSDDKVVVSGIHLVRPGTIIKPDLIEMPVTQFLDGSLTETKPSK
ncbi:MAG: efflux RND transporter periplasmic adaptor subunit [Gemmataceae bacterium]|nr:efflux RND transporter periplasmic adaptor subunit [Gemmataceae bacterium]